MDRRNNKSGDDKKENGENPPPYSAAIAEPMKPSALSARCAAL